MKDFCYSSLFLILLQFVSINDCCIHALDWKPSPVEERTSRADLVVTGKILYTEPIDGFFYAATFQVISVLKGWDLIQKLHREKSKAIVSLDPKIVATALGFGSPLMCYSSVEVGESYILFLGHNPVANTLVGKYDNAFGAAEILYQRTERDILSTLGWEEWSSWTHCGKSCGTGIQSRSRKCRHQSKGICHGPTNQQRECNTFSCNGAVDVLSFISSYESDNFSPWQRSGEIDTNSVDQKPPSSAPTYLLFDDNLPKSPVFRITFKGPIDRPQYLFSIFNANNEMLIGIKITSFSLNFVYTSNESPTFQKPSSKILEYEFDEDVWYDIAFLIAPDEIKLQVNCEDIHQVKMEKYIFENFDIYGRMYLGASSREGKESFVRVEMTQITVLSDPAKFWHQCGKMILDDDIMLPGEEGSGNGNAENIDDSESGDVNEDYGSGRFPQDCDCLNGGICKDSKCKCPFGWEGESCQTPICKNPCLNKGTCMAPNKCMCDIGHYGEYCQFSHCILPCKNNGTCIGTSKCKCLPGFTGLQCNEVACPKPCLNRGKCNAHGKCECSGSYDGEQCQNKRRCKRYSTKLVSYLRPATVYTYVDQVVPCKENKDAVCKRKILQYRQTDQIGYRPEYICEPE